MWPAPAFQPKVGDFCELEGVTGPGDFAPVINGSKLTWLGLGVLSEPLHPTWDQLMNGSLDTQYVEIQGVVTEAGDQRITLLTRMGRINLGIWGAPQASLTPYENALVRVRGVLFPSWDKETHRVKYGEVFVNSCSLCVDEPAMADPPSRKRQSHQGHRGDAAELWPNDGGHRNGARQGVA
jgi:hypothetical protein